MNEKYNNVIQCYAQALQKNDYPGIVKLFSKKAKIFSFLAGEQKPKIFFQNLFKNSFRRCVEIRNIFFDANNKKMAAVYLHLDAVLNQKHAIIFDAVDLFEFDSQYKIKTLKIILDTHPIRTLKNLSDKE